MTIDRILQLIRKLIAHEESARKIGSVQEAEAFAARIQSLCDRYRLRLADLSAEELDEHVNDEFWTHQNLGRKAQQRSAPWIDLLAVAVAKGHACRVIGTQGQCKFRFTGVQADAAVASAMFGVLLLAGEYAWRQASQKDGRLKRRLFLFGFSVAINNRYFNGASQRDTNGKALVVTINAAIDSHLSGVKTKSSGFTMPKRRSKSLELGYRAGQQTSLSSQTLSSAAPKLNAAT